MAPPAQAAGPRSQGKAWVTLLTNGSYVPTLLVFHRSLRDIGSRYPLVVMTTDTVGAECRQVMLDAGMLIKDIELLLPDREVQHAYPRFRDVWSKLRAFELEEYERVILIDSDMLVRQNMDELMDFELPGEDWIAAVHACTCNPGKVATYPADWIPANCGHTGCTHPSGATTANAVLPTSAGPSKLLNSGLVILTPSLSTFSSICHYLLTSPLVSSFRFVDQDLLAAFFEGKWKPLPYVYNALKPMQTCHADLWRDEAVKNVHFILDKPWERRVRQEDVPRLEKSWDAVMVWWWDAWDRMEREEKEGRGVVGWERWKAVVVPGLGDAPRGGKTGKELVQDYQGAV